MFRIKILKADEHASPAGKLADAEIHFTEDAGPLAGLKLIGFAIWEARTANARRNVTFPARTYSVNGERRSFALLRPSQNAPDHGSRWQEGENATAALRDLVLAAYEAHEQDDARHGKARSTEHSTVLTADGLARLEF